MSESDENIIYIGRKPAMNYVMACFTVIQKNLKKLILKARGRAISKAVDVIEILRNRFMKDQVSIESIETGTEQIESEDRGTFSVSTIAITANIK
ncbi:MAG: DNA-binding protein Alba [Candidatus Lokiarchaeota archaeon]|nr:DNA-binding protein Alba [Candidatus Lokiarchaeota archaeon]